MGNRNHLHGWERRQILPSLHSPSLSSYFPSKIKHAVFYLILLVNARKSQEKTLEWFIGICSLESCLLVADSGEFILFVVIETWVDIPRQYCVHSVVWTTRSKGSSCKGVLLHTTRQRTRNIVIKVYMTTYQPSYFQHTVLTHPLRFNGMWFRFSKIKRNSVSQAKSP